MLNLPKWNIEAVTGYVPKTTFWEDFSIADVYGAKAIQNTYNRAFSEWKSDVVYLTELTLVLNHKCWQHYQKNDELSQLYSNLYYQAREYAVDNLEGEDFEYFYRITD